MEKEVEQRAKCTQKCQEIWVHHRTNSLMSMVWTEHAIHSATWWQEAKSTSCSSPPPMQIRNAPKSAAHISSHNPPLPQWLLGVRHQRWSLWLKIAREGQKRNLTLYRCWS
ncbi:hypothetical protein SKAU_G00172150 [Synaphobranchus kaupii]|uniref:Uncharacterized protein n=1 Tax=Synaphobranchus kaupii TaxID=118154 RepID=A0A9Q1J0T6_SYNKA|nr:hypothetical protein SKAU_G00172150 [Synaphobranchus kaupii]